MSCDPAFGDLMHFLGTDLDLYTLAGWTDDRGVERLVCISLRHGNVVFESTWYRFVRGMNHSERFVAFGDVVNDDTKRDHIIDLVVIGFAALHLFEDGIE